MNQTAVGHFGVVDAMLAKRLTEALRDPALDLSFDDHRIYDSADIVHAPVTSHLNFSCVGIDLDFAGVCTVAPCKAVRIVNCTVLKPEFKF